MTQKVQREWTNPLECENGHDAAGNPTGGSVRGIGLIIDWQAGALGRGAEKKEPTGAFVEDVVLAAIQRVEYYQQSQYNCDENAVALGHLQEALAVFQARHDDREARGVQGLHLA